VPLAHRRAQGLTIDVHGEDLRKLPSTREIKAAKDRMESTPFLIDTLINGTSFTESFFDNGCIPYAAFSEKTVRTHRLPRIPIDAKQLALAKESHENGEDLRITHMTYATIDIDGRAERVYGYIVKGLSFPIILGKAWAERNSVRYIAAKRKLFIGRGHQRITIREKGWLERNKEARNRLAHVRSARLVSGSVFAAIIGRAQRRLRRNGPDGTQILAISMSDINKALSKLAERKQKQTEEEIRQEIPEEIAEHADAFLDDEDGEIAPHQEGRDHAIELVRDEQGREAAVP
jgi:hypothetical protein